MTPGGMARCLTMLEALADTTRSRWSEASKQAYGEILDPYPDEIAEPIIKHIRNNSEHMPLFSDLRRMLRDEVSPDDPWGEPEGCAAPEEAKRALREGYLKEYRRIHPECELTSDEIMRAASNNAPIKAIFRALDNRAKTVPSGVIDDKV